MAKPKTTRRTKTAKTVTRYTYDKVKEPRTPETGHTALLPGDEQVVTLPMDNGWSRAIDVERLAAAEDGDPPVVVDMWLRRRRRTPPASSRRFGTAATWYFARSRREHAKAEPCWFSTGVPPIPLPADPSPSSATRPTRRRRAAAPGDTPRS